MGMGFKNPEINPCFYSEKHFFDVFQDEDRLSLPFGGFYKGLDASLGISGLPQSATGQTAIFTGENGAHLLGYHLNGFPNQKLKKILLEKSILKKLKERGYQVDFLNTYRPPFFEKTNDQKLKRASCSTVSALAAGLECHSQEDLFQRKSICHDLTNEVFRDQGFEAPLLTPAESGQILVKASSESDFLLFEFFLTDLAGHAQDMNRACHELRKVEEFLETILLSITLEQTTMLIISDHGNFEDLSTRSHTRNPALFMAWGEEAPLFIEKCLTPCDPYHIILELMP